MRPLGLACLVILFAASAWGQAERSAPVKPFVPPTPQPILAPQACTCSPPTTLGEDRGQAASHIANCQCGALQCVVHIESGRMSCH